MTIDNNKQAETTITTKTNSSLTKDQINKQAAKVEKSYLDSVDKCSRCGACMAVCPVFEELGREAFVCRGKVELLDNLRSGNLQWNGKMADIFNTCLLCGACAQACNSGVKGDKLFLSARRDLVEARGLPLIKKSIFRHFLRHNGRLKLGGKALSLYSRLGVRKVVQKTHLLNIFPYDMASIEGLLPDFPKQNFRKLFMSGQLPKAKNGKMKIAYFTGCMTNLANPHIGLALMKILAAYEVDVILPEQWCCGIPAISSGDFKTGLELAQKNINSFAEDMAKEKVDYILFDCASCLSTWLEYEEWLPDSRIKELLPKLMDANRFLVEVLDIHFQTEGSGTKVTYHDACHLKFTPSGRTAPRELLKRMAPRYQFVEMSLADRCCGSAGSFNITHYDLSQRILARKIDSIEASGAKIVTAPCPSCLMQLNNGLKDKPQIKAQHLLELAADCLEHPVK
ncbi:MAG: (Fe-S)-binding protein [Clostridiales bacterium]